MVACSAIGRPLVCVAPRIRKITKRFEGFQVDNCKCWAFSKVNKESSISSLHKTELIYEPDRRMYDVIVLMCDGSTDSK